MATSSKLATTAKLPLIFLVVLRELRESQKIVRQALERLKPGPIKADAPKVVLPDRDDMRKHMDSLIHHFLIVAEGFNVPAGEVYLAGDE